jgi:hypothetical protein
MVVFLPGKDWFSCLLDGDDNLVDIIDFDPLYICENNGPAIRRQFPYAGDFWLIWTDADPATHTILKDPARMLGLYFLHSFEDGFGDSFLPGGCWMERCLVVEALHPWSG